MSVRQVFCTILSLSTFLGLRITVAAQSKLIILFMLPDRY